MDGCYSGLFSDVQTWICTIAGKTSTLCIFVAIYTVIESKTQKFEEKIKKEKVAPGQCCVGVQ